MKRMIVMSDSHGERETLCRLVQQAWAQCPGQVDAYIHCGDGARDFADLKEMLLAHDPEAQLHMVKGNCDTETDVPDEAQFELEGLRIMICHGQAYRVRLCKMFLRHAAARRGCAVALYGHTHVPAETSTGRVTMFNPGAAKLGCIGLMEVNDGRATFHRLQLDECGKFKEA